MNRLFQQVLLKASCGMKDVLQARSQCPLQSFNKVCFGYLSNDWFMVFTNLVILTISVAFLLIAMHNTRGIS